jgi:hypothetical protein
MAGEPVQLSSKGVSPTVEAADYEANRGLLTLQGPTGMFINPTSATLPAGAFTVQYCFLLPDFEFGETMAHGALISYGVTDWLELGANVLFVDLDPGDTLFSAGPLARVRLLKHDGWIPQVSVGGYGKIGDDPIQFASAFLAMTERFEIKQGPLESVALHAGVRQTWRDDVDSFRGYFGTDIQLPWRLYIVGEIATQSEEEDFTPWAAGLQWRAGGINISTAAVTAPETGGEVGFFFGIGTQF